MEAKAQKARAERAERQLAQADRDKHAFALRTAVDVGTQYGATRENVLSGYASKNNLSASDVESLVKDYGI